MLCASCDGYPRILDRMVTRKPESSRKPPRTSVVAGCESDISASHTLPSNRDRTTVKNSMMNAAYVDCPYCDGENIVTPVKSIGIAHDLSQREIACRHCQSLFLPSESKYS